MLRFNTATGAIDPSQTSQFTFPNNGGVLTGTSGVDMVSDSNGLSAMVKYNAGDTIGPDAFDGTTGTASGSGQAVFPKSPYFVGLEIQNTSLSGLSLNAAPPGAGTPSTFYGYAEIDVGQNLIGLVDQYAFQTDGTAITVPGGTSVPEPGSLALLAMGAAGVGAFRRRNPIR